MSRLSKVNMLNESPEKDLPLTNIQAGGGRGFSGDLLSVKSVIGYPRI